MEKGCSTAGRKNGIEIKEGLWKVHFKTKFGTPTGHVFGFTIIHDKEKEIVVVAKHKAKEYLKAHQLLGPPGRDQLLGSCKQLHWNLSNTSKCM